MSTTWDATAQSTGVLHIFTKHRSRPAVFDMVSAPESQYTRRNNSINNRATLWQTVLRHIHRHNSGGRTTLYARRACIYLLVCWYPGQASDFHLCEPRAESIRVRERSDHATHRQLAAAAAHNGLRYVRESESILAHIIPGHKLCNRFALDKY